MAVTYLTGIFRSVRFGIGEAHGKGALIQLNWMMEKGAFTYDEETGTYKVHFDKFRDAVKGLSQALLDIQRKGSYEEGAKFLVLRYLLTSYDSRRDAVTYGIGHSAFETFGNGMTCLGLIGTGRAAPDLLPVNLWAYAEGTLFCIALTVLIFYGICTEKSRIMLPTAMFIHFIFNAGSALIGKSILSISLSSLLTAGLCFAAYRCWNDMFTQYDE